ncbi:MAG TPA: dihydrodipicolinate synthase family protein [Terriglobia bacterium]|jgi:5-dehydro-4-deoxyglucarate dehydratase|nr:dihydrodipicolinate synthase family protein [Terriglobia bacterium]
MPLESQVLKSALRGIIGFGVTPFREDLSVDIEALRQNASFLVEHCEVVVPLAGNGEIYSLSPEEHKMIGRTVVEEVHGRRPVVVGVGLTMPLAREMAMAAETYGADGILVLPPYFTHANDDGLFDYYRTIAEATKLGVILFQTHAVNFSPSLLRRLAEIPNIIGMKDEHGDMDQFVRQWAAVGDRMALLCGVGEILAPSYYALGVKAFTSGLVNFMPGTCRKILSHLEAGELEEASRVVEQETLAIYDLRVKRPGYRTLVIKEAMNLCGLNAGRVRPPLAPLPEEDRRTLRTVLKKLGLLKSGLAPA